MWCPIEDGQDKEIDFSLKAIRKEHGPDNNLEFSPLRFISDLLSLEL